MSLQILSQPSGGGGSGASTTQAGSTAIIAGVSTVTVTFATTFGSIPTVRISMARPTGEPLIQANIRTGAISTTQFIADLSAATPSANYVISWEASA